MKLATLRDRSRDGRLVVVSRDLTLCSDARHLAPTLQAALDAWDEVAPELERIARGIETGGQPVSRFHERDALAPLPRAYQRADPGGRHGVRTFAAPRAPAAPGPSAAAIAALTGDLPRGADEAAARAAIRLLVLMRQTGGVAALAPAAVTPDELGTDEHTVELDSAPVAHLRTPDLAAVVARAARDRALAAGCIVAEDYLVESSDSPRIEVRDPAHRSIFGAIERAAPP
jgi:fumarylacetoacetate (FAA) hydrolase